MVQQQFLFSFFLCLGLLAFLLFTFSIWKDVAVKPMNRTWNLGRGEAFSVRGSTCRTKKLVKWQKKLVKAKKEVSGLRPFSFVVIFVLLFLYLRCFFFSLPTVAVLWGTFGRIGICVA